MDKSLKKFVRTRPFMVHTKFRLIYRIKEDWILDDRLVHWIPFLTILPWQGLATFMTRPCQT